jgi:mannose-6-phosphate isomerase-like protein (cupin superfamily)
MSLPLEETWITLVRHAAEAPRRLTTGGAFQRLIDEEDAGRVAAFVQVVDLRREREHYHRRSAELYYVLDGEGQIVLDGQAQELRAGSIVHVPPGVIHAVRGTLRVLVVGIPEISDEDTHYLDE